MTPGGTPLRLLGAMLAVAAHLGSAHAQVDPCIPGGERRVPAGVVEYLLPGEYCYDVLTVYGILRVGSREFWGDVEGDDKQRASVMEAARQSADPMSVRIVTRLWLYVGPHGVIDASAGGMPGGRPGRGGDGGFGGTGGCSEGDPGVPGNDGKPANPGGPGEGGGGGAPGIGTMGQDGESGVGVHGGRAGRGGAGVAAPAVAECRQGDGNCARVGGAAVRTGFGMPEVDRVAADTPVSFDRNAVVLTWVSSGAPRYTEEIVDDPLVMYRTVDAYFTNNGSGPSGGGGGGGAGGGAGGGGDGPGWFGMDGGHGGAGGRGGRGGGAVWLESEGTLWIDRGTLRSRGEEGGVADEGAQSPERACSEDCRCSQGPDGVNPGGRGGVGGAGTSGGGGAGGFLVLRCSGPEAYCRLDDPTFDLNGADCVAPRGDGEIVVLHRVGEDPPVAWSDARRPGSGTAEARWAAVWQLPLGPRALPFLVTTRGTTPDQTIVLEFPRCPIAMDPDSDADGDCIGDAVDNCPGFPNPTQADNDADGLGDVCDNCPAVSNHDQLDSDADGAGDRCDNCPAVSNPDQHDDDGDSVGDVCDGCPYNWNTNQEDGDGDGFQDACDNCPARPNVDHADFDSDSVGDVCDNCAAVSNSDQADHDGDLVGDVCDNCPDDSNPDQRDSDADGCGDACDASPRHFDPSCAEREFPRLPVQFMEEDWAAFCDRYQYADVGTAAEGRTAIFCTSPDLPIGSAEIDDDGLRYDNEAFGCPLVVVCGYADDSQPTWEDPRLAYQRAINASFLWASHNDRPWSSANLYGDLNWPERFLQGGLVPIAVIPVRAPASRRGAIGWCVRDAAFSTEVQP